MANAAQAMAGRSPPAQPCFVPDPLRVSESRRFGTRFGVVRVVLDLDVGDLHEVFVRNLGWLLCHVRQRKKPPEGGLFRAEADYWSCAPRRI